LFILKIVDFLILLIILCEKGGYMFYQLSKLSEPTFDMNTMEIDNVLIYFENLIGSEKMVTFKRMESLSPESLVRAIIMSDVKIEEEYSFNVYNDFSDYLHKERNAEENSII